MVHDQYVSSTGKIPEEAKALSLLAPAPPVASLMSGGGLLPIPSPATLQNRGLPLANLGVLKTSLDTSVAALSGITSQPPLMGNVDPSKINEIRRTVYVGNLNSQTTTAEQLLEFFKQVGDVKFVRMAGDETQPTRFAFVEFADQDSVSRALTFNGVMFGDRPLKINHSNNAIVKPPELTPQAAAKELEDVMKRVREAQSTIAAAIEPVDVKQRSSSRSRHSRRSRSRSRSRSHSKRKRPRSKHGGQASQRSRQSMSDSLGSHGRRSRSRDRKHSRSRSHSRDKRNEKEGKVRKDNDWDEKRQRDKKGRTPLKGHSNSRHSRSISRGHKRRSKSRSRSPRRRARSPSPKRGKKERKRNKERNSSRERRESPVSRRKSRDSDHKAKYLQVDHEQDSYMEGSGSAASDDKSPQVHHNGSYWSAYAEEDELSAAE
ncbi:splicing regulatory glutamine/lysine-rich protein 1 isoform X2 [Xyrauchen texanus]|uniref:splicing regulatory glutamine/lysine-rich protein 1 isoform X2 n=1 Tax=Xyrauchen texanus TaxID=154827 RepID=UPI002241A5CE|nr:splicing regulatory glutamine/lysine-rich protein 1 isoform X2 [Xyrauchen texanus]XP_051953848.1 splicing regulatory glutamine/lysine-rich protein 1 isoform X2 [Xyrauchen texanus]